MRRRIRGCSTAPRELPANIGVVIRIRINEARICRDGVIQISISLASAF
jgi:hypothetical protein